MKVSKKNNRYSRFFQKNFLQERLQQYQYNRKIQNFLQNLQSRPGDFDNNHDCLLECLPDIHLAARLFSNLKKIFIFLLKVT